MHNNNHNSHNITTLCKTQQHFTVFRHPQCSNWANHRTFSQPTSMFYLVLYVKHENQRHSAGVYWFCPRVKMRHRQDSMFSLFAKGAMLFLLYFCAQKTSQSESPHRDCSSRIQRHTMAKTKVGKKQGAELCTVNIFFKNNTRTKMFLLNQILFLVKYNKINSIK